MLVFPAIAIAHLTFQAIKQENKTVPDFTPGLGVDQWVQGYEGEGTESGTLGAGIDCVHTTIRRASTQ